MTLRNVTVPGFQFAGVSCGIKRSRKKDLALIFTVRPATAAALFTTNRVKAAPILVGMKGIRRGRLQAVVINSGNANACTGRRGVRDAETMCREVARHLHIDPSLVIPSSTGLIGVALPMARVKQGIESAVSQLGPQSFGDAAEAILTTDRFAKVASARCLLGGRRVVVAGMAKGAGMIAPRMATMLAYILTDADVERRALERILRAASEGTFNSVTVDGDTSTNDSVVFLANGSAGNPRVRSGGRAERTLLDAVQKVMRDLALKLVADGEGATKLVEICVKGAASVAAAKRVAFAVANSTLVKTAFFGADPNFGRILAAVGYSGVRIIPERVDLYLNKVRVARNGMGVSSAERRAAQVMQRKTFRVSIHLHQGNATASVWTSDLSHEYVRINSAYRT